MAKRDKTAKHMIFIHKTMDKKVAIEKSNNITTFNDEAWLCEEFENKKDFEDRKLELNIIDDNN